MIILNELAVSMLLTIAFIFIVIIGAMLATLSRHMRFRRIVFANGIKRLVQWSHRKDNDKESD